MKFALVLLLLGAPTWADVPRQLTLGQFLDDVKAHNPDARAALDNIVSFEWRAHEAEIPLMPEAYVNYNASDDFTPQQLAEFMGTETRVNGWKAGLRQQTEYGLSADVSYNATRTIVENASPLFLPYADYYQTRAQVMLTQSFWRNGFGESTRAQVEANRAGTELQLLQAKFKLKSILLNAENAYWSVVSYNQVVKLQQENVERAHRLRVYFDKRTKLKLFDDTDLMQAQASLEARDLELQTSLDERSVIVRSLNTLRGVDKDVVEDLETLPPRAAMQTVEKNPHGEMSREDFEMLRAQAKVDREKARYAQSQIKPQFDMTATFATNGRDGLADNSIYQSETNHYPMWAVGVSFSVPLDFGMVRDLRRGFRSASAAADAATEQATFSEARAWDDLLKQKTEAQGRYERALSVEKIQTELVKREHRRLLDGRATTFEAINFEQNLALAQIQRVRAQLALLQIHNAIKTFEAAR